MKKLRLLYHTVKHLKSQQIVGQLKSRISKAKFEPFKVPEGQIFFKELQILRYSCMRGKDLEFLNLSKPFDGWNDTSYGMLWAYNLNYMDWLGQAGMSLEEGSRWIDRFIEDLPTNKIGLDAYPIALRGINWIKFISRYREDISRDVLKRWNDSLYSQYKLLERKLEYHLLGNHLLEDAFSIFIGATYFQDEKLFAKAKKLLLKELKEQVLPDGAHYEQSPMYHCILLDRLLDCVNISPDEQALKEYAVKMLGHMEAIAWSDSSIPLLNDAAYGIAPTVAQIRDYAKLLGLEWETIPMKECGYRKLLSPRMEAVIDVGNVAASYQPGHTHADTFNYELRIDGEPFIVDTGISTYNKTERRQYERSSQAHNTVTVGEKDSSEVWGGFRVGNRAKVIGLLERDNEVVATHNGYKPVMHTRSWKLDGDSLTISDLLSKDAEGESWIHFAPDVEILSFDRKSIKTNRGVISIANAQGVEIKDGEVSREYNRFQKAKIARIAFRGKMSYTIQ